MRAAHFRKLQEIPDEMETGTTLDWVIKEVQYNIYRHVASIVGESALTRAGYPDFWTPEPSAKVRTGFRLTVFRKGRWPTPHGAYVSRPANPRAPLLHHITTPAIAVRPKWALRAHVSFGVIYSLLVRAARQRISGC